MEIKDKNEVIEKVKKYSDLVKAVFPVEKIILYGSYSRGTAREHSDIDVAVIVDKFPGGYLESRVKLFQMRRDIDLRIEPVLIERGEKDPGGFLEEILTTGEVIYP